MCLNLPKTEEETLRVWKEIDAFQTQLRLNEGHEHFTFYGWMGRRCRKV